MLIFVSDGQLFILDLGGRGRTVSLFMTATVNNIQAGLFFIFTGWREFPSTL